MSSGREQPKPDRAAQREFFERDPRRVARLYRDSRWSRNVELKRRLAAARLAGARILVEVGLGAGPALGTLLEELPASTRYLGFDLALGPLREARRYLGPGRLVNAAAERCPVASGSVDAVFLLDVLHHLDQPSALAEIARMLSPAGRLLCLEPNPRHPANVIYRGDPIERGLFELRPVRVREWMAGLPFDEVALDPVAIVFPGLPRFLFPLYRHFERAMARRPALLRWCATTLALSARRTADP